MSRFRPPPTRRVRPTGIPSAGSACWAYSRKPAEIVVRDNPVACETTAIPPQPRGLASHAAHSRRVLSSSSGLSTRNFCLIICSSCMYPYTHLRVDIANLFLRKSLYLDSDLPLMGRNPRRIIGPETGQDVRTLR